MSRKIQIILRYFTVEDDHFIYIKNPDEMVIIIDEVSMMHALTLDLINARLQQATKSNEPFGGVKLILVGDLHQLPPVVKKNEQDILTQLGYPIPFFFAAKAFPKNTQFIELTETYRQTDKQFIQLLGRIRQGEVYSADLTMLNEHIAPPPDDALHLVPTNALADRINQNKLDTLPGKVHSYTMTTTGQFDTSQCRAPQLLKLKLNSQVIFVKNGEGYSNGECATVTSLAEDDMVVKTTKGKTIHITRDKWEQNSYQLVGKKITTKVVGTAHQLPIRLGFASTIHGIQGSTLSGKVHLDLGNGAFAPGHTYVALSRITELRNLTLAHAIKCRDIMVDQHVVDFYQRRGKVKKHRKLSHKEVGTSCQL